MQRKYFFIALVVHLGMLNEEQQLLLGRLRNKTMVTLKASPVHGIGVFALCDIPAGNTEIFPESKTSWIGVPIAEVDKLPHHAKEMVATYCLYDEQNYFIPDTGFNQIDPVIYLNHSDNPNVESLNDGEVFRTIRAIAAGEELLIDYTHLSEGLNDYQEQQFPA